MEGNDGSVGLEVNNHSTQGKKKALPRRLINHKGDSNLSESKIQNKSKSLNKNDNLSEILKTGIFLDIQGVIEEGTFPEGDQIFCKYDIVYGKDWKLISGQKSGQSQYACLGEGSNFYFVWNISTSQ